MSMKERFEDVVKSYAGHKVDIEPELLWSLYWGQDLLPREIAKIFGCGRTTVFRRMVEYGIPCKTVGGYHGIYTDFVFDDKQRQIFEGCMMGDGGLTLSSKYPYFNYSDNHKEYVVWIADKLGISDISRIDPMYYFSGAMSPYGYRLITRVVPSLKVEYPRWYPNGSGTREHFHNKIFPKDMDLTSVSLLFWYIGDGHFQKDVRAIFLTNTLDFDIAELFANKIKKLLDVDDSITLNRRHDKYVVRVGKKRVPEFLDLIVQDDIPECYHYKFPGYFEGGE